MLKPVARTILPPVVPITVDVTPDERVIQPPDPLQLQQQKQSVADVDFYSRTIQNNNKPVPSADC